MADVHPRSESLTVFFPVYNDEATVRRVTEKALRVCGELTDVFEVIIVDDGSPDASGVIADELAHEHQQVRVVHHPRNRGYGAAVRSGLAESRHEWICFTDGDDEDDLRDLKKLWRLRAHYDLIITFRYVRRYSGLSRTPRVSVTTPPRIRPVVSLLAPGSATSVLTMRDG